MSDQVDILKLVAGKLQEAGIPYMVSGSVAMNFYAQPRMTRDIDIVVELAAKDARRLHKLFSPAFYIDEQDIQEAVAAQGMFNLIHNDTIVKIDFIVRKETAYRKTEFDRRRPISVEGVAVMVVAPEDLILSKLFWAKDSLSELQLNDVRNLISYGQELDWGYMTRWAAQLGVAELLEKTRKQ